MAALRAVVSLWRPIETAPKDGKPILGWCVHEADPYFLENGNLTLYGAHTEGLTLYGAHTEGMSHVEDGPNVIVWGGAWDDSSYEYDGGWMPAWWWQYGSNFEVTANPTHWMPIDPPE